MTLTSNLTPTRSPLVITRDNLDRLESRTLALPITANSIAWLPEFQGERNSFRPLSGRLLFGATKGVFVLTPEDEVLEALQFNSEGEASWQLDFPATSIKTNLVATGPIAAFFSEFEGTRRVVIVDPIRGGSVVTEGRDATAFALAPQERNVLVASGETLFFIENPARGVANPARQFPSPISLLQFNPDGETFVVAYSSYVDLWSAADHDQGRIGRFMDIDIEQFFGHVTSADFAPDGSLLALGNKDGKLNIYPADSMIPQATFAGHASLISTVAFSPDGGLLASGDESGQVVIWDTQTGEQVMATKLITVLDIEWSEDGESLYILSGTTSLWIGSVRSE